MYAGRRCPVSVLARLDVPAEAFLFGSVLDAYPDLRVRLERVVPTGSGPMPYFWVGDEHVRAVEDALRTAGDIESFEPLDSADGETLVRVGWRRLPTEFLGVLSDAGATMYRGVGEGDTWRFTLRFPDHEDMTAFYRTCVDRDIPVELRTVDSSDAETEPTVGREITDAQRDTILAALEAGYFDVPRRVNLTELAQQLDISDTAASQRIRRGISTLLTQTLTSTETELAE